MPDRITVFCKSRSPVSRGEITGFIDDMCVFDEDPEYFPKEEATTQVWNVLEVRYDPEKRPVQIQYETRPDPSEHQTGSFENEMMTEVIAKEIEELTGLEGAEVIISHLKETYQFFMIEFGWTATEECHEMTEVLASYLANTYDGIIQDGTGYYNSSFDYLLKYPE